MTHYYDREGRPIDLETWSRLFSDETYKRLAVTRLDNGTEILTAWAGYDHRQSDRPMIFETMAFSGLSAPVDIEQYSTEAEARAGHDAVVVRRRHRGQTT